MQRVYAAIINPVLPPEIGSGGADQGLVSAGNYISSIVSLLLIVASLGTLIFLVIGGIQWIVAGGDKTNLEHARERITQAIVGLIGVASACAIWLLIGRFLGIDFESLPFPTLG